MAAITGAGNGSGAAAALAWLRGGSSVVAGDVQPAHLQCLQARRPALPRPAGQPGSTARRWMWPMSRRCRRWLKRHRRASGAWMCHRGCEQAAADRIRALQPWPEPGTADDIAAVVLSLLGDGARFITGETLPAHGGLFARGPALLGDGAAKKLLRSARLDTGSTGLPGRVDPQTGP